MKDLEVSRFYGDFEDTDRLRSCNICKSSEFSKVIILETVLCQSCAEELIVNIISSCLF